VAAAADHELRIGDQRSGRRAKALDTVLAEPHDGKPTAWLMAV
jgi:hypothetical protein